MALDLDALETSFDLLAPRGDEWRAEYDRAWVEALTIVADAMLSGAGSSPTGAAAADGPSPAAT